MSFEQFLETAWTDHADNPQEVADRLAASFDVITAPEQIAPFAQLLVHVHGEHLGQWQAGAEVLNALRSVPAFDANPAAAAALDCGVAALQYAGGNVDALERLALEGKVQALATAASALAGREDLVGALAAYSLALHLAGDTLPDASPAIRALAVGGNNLAVVLEGKKDRSAAETHGMIAAARGGLKYWKLAGTWLEQERAEYRLARSLIQTGQAEAAIACARRCVETCTLNAAPAFEKFFGFAVLALARRAAGDLVEFEAARTTALTWYEQVPDEDKAWCESDLRELKG